MYHKLLKKYDIDEKALQKDKLSKHWFTYETDIEENLLVQIFYMVTGDPEYFRRTSRTRGTQCGCICTDFEKTEIRFYFEFYKDALNQELEAFGLDHMPICVAKTQYSLSDNPALLGAPKNFTVTVKDVRVCTGAGFIVCQTSNIMTMPGLPKVPAANRMDIDENGIITGLF